MLLYNRLKNKINDIIDEEIVDTFAYMKKIIRIAKHANINKKAKWLLYIAIGILSSLFIVVAFVLAVLSTLFTVVLEITASIILIIPGVTLVAIINYLEREDKENERLY